MIKLITNKNELRAICQALNKIYWKLANPYSKDSLAEKLVVELEDCGIKIKWDNETEEFII